MVTHTLSVDGSVHGAAAHQVDATARKYFLRDRWNYKCCILGRGQGEVHMDLVADENLIGVQHGGGSVFLSQGQVISG